MKKVTETELSTARCSMSEFGRIVGLSRGRIWQLKRAGLILTDESGVLIAESLKRFWLYRAVRRYVETQPTDEYFQRVLMTA